MYSGPTAGLSIWENRPDQAFNLAYGSSWLLLAPPGCSWLLLLLFGEPGRARRSQEKPGGASYILLLQSLSASFVTFMLPA